jgi:hypothetical protein
VETETNSNKSAPGVSGLRVPAHGELPVDDRLGRHESPPTRLAELGDAEATLSAEATVEAGSSREDYWFDATANAYLVSSSFRAKTGSQIGPNLHLGKVLGGGYQASIWCLEDLGVLVFSRRFSFPVWTCQNPKP